MLGRRNQKEPTRFLHPRSADLPPFGPEATGLAPHLAPSIYCSWCGNETEIRKDVKVCLSCDESPAFPIHQ